MFFGTANNDFSTYTISDKVYDRAISLFFDDKGHPFDAEEQEPNWFDKVFFASNMILSCVLTSSKVAAVGSSSI